VEIIYYSKYKEKKQDSNYRSIKPYLEKEEKKLRNLNALDDLLVYQNLSTKRKSLRIADSEGGYRIVFFKHENYCLMVDFEKKAELEKHNSTSKALIEDYSDEEFIDFIENNKSKDKIERIDISEYKSSLKINKEIDNICLESKNFSELIVNFDQKLYNVPRKSDQKADIS